MTSARQAGSALLGAFLKILAVGGRARATALLRVETAVLATAGGLGILKTQLHRMASELLRRLRGIAASGAVQRLRGRLRIPRLRVPSLHGLPAIVGLMLVVVAAGLYLTVGRIADPAVEIGEIAEAMEAPSEPAQTAAASPPVIAPVVAPAEPAVSAPDEPEDYALVFDVPPAPDEPEDYALVFDVPPVPQTEPEVSVAQQSRLPGGEESQFAMQWFGDPEPPVIVPTPRVKPAAPELAPELVPEPEPELAFVPPPAPDPSRPPPWIANAVQTNPYDTGHPIIAIVIDDVGVAQDRSAAIMELPPPLTMAIIPYGENLDVHTRRARERGHELLVHLPMEPTGAAADPGPNALLTGLGQAEIMRRVKWGMGRLDGYVGVSNHMGSKFMERKDMVGPVLSLLRERGLMFLDSRTTAASVGAGLAQDMGIPNASRDVFLDNEQTLEAVRGQLARLEQIARRQGYAVGIGHPHDVTREALADWLPAARKRGIVFVPITAIVKHLQKPAPRPTTVAEQG